MACGPCAGPGVGAALGCSQLSWGLIPRSQAGNDDQSQTQDQVAHTSHKTEQSGGKDITREEYRQRGSNQHKGRHTAARHLPRSSLHRRRERRSVARLSSSTTSSPPRSPWPWGSSSTSTRRPCRCTWTRPRRSHRPAPPSSTWGKRHRHTLHRRTCTCRRCRRSRTTPSWPRWCPWRSLGRTRTFRSRTGRQSWRGGRGAAVSDGANEWMVLEQEAAAYASPLQAQVCFPSVFFLHPCEHAQAPSGQVH